MVELKTTAKAILAELQARGVPAEVIDAEAGLLRYYKDDHWHILRGSTPVTSSYIGGYISERKPLANAVAVTLGIPTPASCVLTGGDHGPAMELLNKYKTLVVKPSGGIHSQGVSVGVTAPDELTVAIADAQRQTPDGGVLVQQQVKGDDIRVLIIGGAFAAASQRVPAYVVGDGLQNLWQLVEAENVRNQDRGENYEKKLNKIDMAAATRFLGHRLDTETPLAGEVVQVVGTANIGTGGEAYDVTDDVRKDASDMIGHAQRLAATLRLDCCGADFLWDRASGSLHFIEVNACPSFSLHLAPSKGEPRNVTKDFVDFLLR